MEPKRHSRVAFLFAVPIALLGGLIGLGGAEFRLPVLVGPLRHPARHAVPLNLVVSLVTVVFSLLIRSRTVAPAPLVQEWPWILAIIGGAGAAAFFGAAWVSRISNRRLETVILALLIVIGLALIVEAFLPQEAPGFLPDGLGWRVAAGVGFGAAIGLASSMLGVAGGEIIIPTLIFAYGVDVKTAGTTSLFISLPTILIGAARYARQGLLADRQPWRITIAPMSAGSVIGATLGGLLAGIAPAAALKFGLGVILNLSAWHIFRKRR